MDLNARVTCNVNIATVDVYFKPNSVMHFFHFDTNQH